MRTVSNLKQYIPPKIRSYWRDLAAENSFPIFCIFLCHFLLSLCFIGWNSAEYTDGIQQITLFHNHTKFWPPLYAFLLNKIFFFFSSSADLNGRLVSILSGSLTLIPTYYLGQTLYSRRVGLYASLLYACAALPNRWNLHVMTDSLFTLLFCLTLLCLVQFLRQPRALPLGLAVFLAGLASLTRYQGLIFLPLLGLGFFQLARQKGKLRLFLPLLGGISWYFLIWWLSSRGFGHFSQYSKRAGHSVITALQSYSLYAEVFLFAHPYTLTYPVFIGAVIGIVKSIGKSRLHTRALQFFSLVFLAWLICHSAFKAFQMRYWLPLFPSYMVLAAFGIECLGTRPLTSRMSGSHVLRRLHTPATYLAICLGGSLIFTALVINYQRDAFGEIRRAARYIETEPIKGRVFSDETTKLPYWSGKQVWKLRKNGYNRLRPGDMVVISSFYTKNFGQEESKIKKFSAIKLKRRIYAELTPLLPDIMVNPRYKMHHPGWIAYRYQRQKFECRIYEVTAKNTPNPDKRIKNKDKSKKS